jgi:non-ribosomal peptide synthetase component E (peptide arylation enzyme)
VGRPRGGTEIRLVDEDSRDVAPDGAGEIWGRGPCCAQGYYRDDEGTRERWTADGWFRTGDIGRKDSGGNLVIVGRKKEVIRRGAQTIIPAELEQMLVAHPKILKVAVIGLPDPRMEERVCAIVVLRPGVSFSFDEMVAFLKEKKLAPYKWPERLELASELPLRGDKIDKQALKEAIVGRAASVEQTG